MSLGRALTRKNSRYGFGGSSSSESSSKRNSISKTKISAPVALISTTNMISYTSPTLRNSLSHGSISSSSSSGSGSPTSLKSPLSGLSPFGDDLDHPSSNHLSTYFSNAPLPPPVRSQSTRNVKSSKSPPPRPRHPSMPPPPTSSSVQRLAWPPTAQPPKELHSARSHNHSSQNPFGAELAQVAEMTEEITGVGATNAEEQFMISRGLQRFRASDYEQEIWQGTSGGVFEDELPSFGAGWI